MNPFKRRVLSGRPDTATWIPGGTPTFRAWEWEKVTGGRDTREMGGGAGGCWVLPLPCVSISNMSNVITGSLAVIRLSNGYLNNAGRPLWLCLFSFWHQVTNIISYKSVICTHHPPVDFVGFFCPRERTFLLHKALVYASREQERQSCATEDVMQRFIPTIGFISWFHWLEKGEKRRNLSLKSAGHNENQHTHSLHWHMATHQCQSVKLVLKSACCILCDVMCFVENMKRNRLHRQAWVALVTVWWQRFDSQVKAAH